MECYPSKWKFVGLFGGACLMAGVAWYGTTLPELKPRVVGWFGLAFCGLCLVVLPVQAFRTGAQVIINDEGIEDRRLKIGVIPWAEIQNLWIGSIRSTKFLCIEVNDPKRYLSRMPRLKRALAKANTALGFPELTITFAGLSPGIDDVWHHLQARGVAPDVRNS